MAADEVLRLQRSIGNHAVGQLLAAIQRKSYVDEGEAVNTSIRDTWGVKPGNRTAEVLATQGSSYARKWWYQKLRALAGATSWGTADIGKRATLSRFLEAGNCDEFGDLAFAELRRLNTGANVAIEQQSGHTYAVTFDDDERNDPTRHTIVDPWVKRTQLRGTDAYYGQGGLANQKAEAKSTGGDWYDAEWAKAMKEALDKQEPKLGEAYAVEKASGLRQAREAEESGADYF